MLSGTAFPSFADGPNLKTTGTQVLFNFKGDFDLAKTQQIELVRVSRSLSKADSADETC